MIYINNLSEAICEKVALKNYLQRNYLKTDN